MAGCTSGQAVKAKTAPLIDMQFFFKNGEKDNFKISPDGNYYSFLAGYKDMLNVFVQKVGDTGLSVSQMIPFGALYGITGRDRG